MPNVFRPELEEEQIEPQETAEAQKATSPRQDPTQQRQNILQRLEGIKNNWQEKDSLLKQELASASGEQEKALKKERLRLKFERNMRLTEEFADSAGWIPILGGLFQSAMYRQKSGQALIWGFGENGEWLTPEERAKQVVKNELKSAVKYYESAIGVAFLVGAPELAVAKAAVSGSKIVRAGAAAGKIALDLKQAKEIADDVGVGLDLLNKVRRGEGLSLEDAIAAAPAILQFGMGGHFAAKGKPVEAAAARFAGKMLRAIPHEPLAEVIREAPQEVHQEAAQELNSFARLITANGREYQDLPLAA